VTLRDDARRSGADGRRATADPVGARRLEKALCVGGVDDDCVLRHLNRQRRFVGTRAQRDLRRFHTLHQTGCGDDGAGHGGDERLFVEIGRRVPVGNLQRHVHAAQTAVGREPVAHARQHGAEQARTELPAMRLVEYGGGAHLPRRPPRRRANEIERDAPDRGRTIVGGEVGGGLNGCDRAHHMRHDVNLHDAAFVRRHRGVRHIRCSCGQLIDVVRVGAHPIARRQPFAERNGFSFEFCHG